MGQEQGFRGPSVFEEFLSLIQNFVKTYFIGPYLTLTQV